MPVRFAVVEPNETSNAPHSRTAACLPARFGKYACQCTNRRDVGNVPAPRNLPPPMMLPQGGDGLSLLSSRTEEIAASVQFKICLAKNCRLATISFPAVPGTSLSHCTNNYRHCSKAERRGR